MWIWLPFRLIAQYLLWKSSSLQSCWLPSSLNSETFGNLTILVLIFKGFDIQRDAWNGEFRSILVNWLFLHQIDEITFVDSSVRSNQSNEILIDWKLDCTKGWRIWRRQNLKFWYWSYFLPRIESSDRAYHHWQWDQKLLSQRCKLLKVKIQKKSYISWLL